MPVLHRWLPPGVRLALPPALLALCLVLANPSRPVPFYVLLPAAALSVALNLLLVVECDALGRIPTLPWTALGLTCATVLVRGFSGIIADEHGSRAAARIYWVYLLVAVPASCAVWVRQDYGLTDAERRQPLFSLPSQASYKTRNTGRPAQLDDLPHDHDDEDDGPDASASASRPLLSSAGAESRSDG
ncbi:hypothetical protein JCM8202_000419 [Rhodotorula sphaerocarpa]